MLPLRRLLRLDAGRLGGGAPALVGTADEGGRLVGRGGGENHELLAGKVHHLGHAVHLGHFLRQALGTQTAPSNQVLVGLSLFLAMIIVQPVIGRVHTAAWEPMSKGQITASAAWEAYEAARERTALDPLTSSIFTWAALAPLACGDLAAAGRWADDAVETTTGWWMMWALSARARVAIAAGEPEQAERDAQDALAGAPEGEAYLFVPDILECLAVLAGDGARHPEAARLLGAACAIRQRMGAVRFKIYDADYETLVAALRDAMGDSDFDTALAEGAGLSAEEAIAHAQRCRGQRKRPSSGWGSLTPAERDVVGLVSEGLTNSDIATRLFISPRTVQTHLTHVYTKLGLTSRVQLAQEATRRG